MWKDNIKDWIGKEIPIFIVGNKIDLDKSREVSSEEGCNVAEKLGAGFIETSAKEQTNIYELFALLTSKIIDAKNAE